MKRTIISILSVAALGLSTSVLSDVGADPGSSDSGMGSSDRTGHEMLRDYPKGDNWKNKQAKKQRGLRGQFHSDDKPRDHPIYSNILRDKR